MSTRGDAWRGKRVTVMGLGVLGGGVGAARYLATHGAAVTVTDMRAESELTQSITLLEGLPVTYHLGGHPPADFTREGADVVVRNPGVPMDSPYLEMARESGVQVEMEMSIFFRDCPAPIIGITGTKGKTTVSELIGTILKTWRGDALLAGNMGISAVLELDRLERDTPVALELSSFQIESLNDHALAPHVAVFTNIFPDHLDRYRTFEHYPDTKRHMVEPMRPSDVVVYNADDPETRVLESRTSATLFPFGLYEREGNAAWLDGETLVARCGGACWSFARPTTLSLSGDHGARNALAAVAAAIAYGVPKDAVERALRAFNGVENRVQPVATVNGVLWVNDTSATAPAAAIAGVRVLAPLGDTLHLVAGGADKRTDLAPFADELANHNVRVYLLDGTATPELADLLANRRVPIAGQFSSMRAAVAAIQTNAVAGDVAALCPACASFGLFRNEFDRGRQFVQAVQSLALPNAMSEA